MEMFEEQVLRHDARDLIRMQNPEIRKLQEECDAINAQHSRAASEMRRLMGIAAKLSNHIQENVMLKAGFEDAFKTRLDSEIENVAKSFSRSKETTGMTYTELQQLRQEYEQSKSVHNRNTTDHEVDEMTREIDMKSATILGSAAASQ